MDRESGRALSGPKCVRQLRNCEDPFLVLLLPLLFAKVGEKAQVVLFCGDASTMELELAFDTVPVQNSRWGRISGIVLSNSGDCLTDFGKRFMQIDSHGLIVLPVDKFADIWYLTAIARKSESIKGKA